MNVHQFLERHGIARNPFAEEDAQTDPVFKDHCIVSTYHPAWDKVYGDPAEPSTSIVFGEKGAGKTAMRLQIDKHVEQHNVTCPDRRLYVIHYDDFNPFLDRFAAKLSARRRRPDRLLSEFRLWDHMDAILSLGVTTLVGRVLASANESSAPNEAGAVSSDALDRLDRNQKRDLLLLAAFYDQSSAETSRQRWLRLRRKLRHWSLRAWCGFLLGITVSLGVLLLALYFVYLGRWSWISDYWWVYLVTVTAVWSPYLWRCGRCWLLARGICKRYRVGTRQLNSLRRTLMAFSPNDLVSQPFPSRDRTDDRYGLLEKLKGVLQTLGFSGIVVLVDRIDEPHVINGSAAMMRALLWPMLDNKFLKQPGLGVKLLLPIELTQFIDREDRDFYQRARLDKQNMIPSLEWTGEALFDVANARVLACAMDGSTPKIREMIDETVTDQRLMEAFRTLRVPRHLFKFLYRLIAAHCNAHSDQEPSWKISSGTFESVLALYGRTQDAADRGYGAG